MGAARKMVNEATITRPGTLHSFPGLEAIAKEKQPEQVPFSWAQRRLMDLGVYVMPESPQTPGININWTTITGIIALCVFIGSLFAFTWSVAYNQGAKDRDMQTLQERLTKAEKDAETAARLAAARSGNAGHEEPKQEPKKK